MPDSSVPPASDDEPDDLSAFDEFVNQHLNFDPKPRTDGGLFGAPAFDNDALDDDGFPPARPAPPPGPFSARTPFGPPPRPASPPAFGAPAPGPAPFPPRMPLPASSDRRWQHGLFSVDGDLEIYYSQPFTSMRVLVIADASRRFNRIVRFIPNIAPGWAAFEIHTSRLVRGFVRQADVRITPIPPQVTRLPERWRLLKATYPRAYSIASNVILSVVAVLTIIACVIALQTGQTTDATDEQRLALMESQIATQQAQLEALEARFRPTALPPKVE